VHTFVIGGDSYTIYTGLTALAFNIVVAVLVQLVVKGSPLREAPVLSRRRA